MSVGFRSEILKSLYHNAFRCNEGGDDSTATCGARAPRRPWAGRGQYSGDAGDTDRVASGMFG